MSWFTRGPARRALAAVSGVGFILWIFTTRDCSGISMRLLPKAMQPDHSGKV